MTRKERMMTKSTSVKNKTKRFKKPEYLDNNHPLNKFLRRIT